MLTPIEQVVAELDVSHGELTAWIERRWVRPVEQNGNYLFDETDRARARLIVELRRDLEVAEDSLPMVLHLLDQIYNLRRALAELQGAIGTLPEEARAALDARLRESSKP